MTAKTVVIVVPAKNEAEAIRSTLTRLPQATLGAMGFRTRVVVLDGRSDDGTAALARQAGATVVRDRGSGKGAALRHARDDGHLEGDFIVMLDGDGTYASDAIPRAVARLAWTDAQVVMGVRRPLPGAMPAMNRIGNHLLSASASLLFARRAADVCTGFWAFRQAALRALPLRSRGFGLEAELFGLCSRLGFTIVRIPVDYLPRRGRPKLSLARDGTRIGRRLLRTRFARLRPADPPVEEQRLLSRVPKVSP